MKLQVTVELSVLEIDGDDVDDETISVSAHCDRDDLVVLKVDGAEPVTVLAADLKSAVERCSR